MKGKFVSDFENGAVSLLAKKTLHENNANIVMASQLWLAFYIVWLFDFQVSLVYFAAILNVHKSDRVLV